jgi:hypothetical protein
MRASGCFFSFGRKCISGSVFSGTKIDSVVFLLECDPFFHLFDSLESKKYYLSFQMKPQVERAIEILEQNIQKELILQCKFNQKFGSIVLIFTDNQIGDKGVIALSECLQSNSSLQKLYLGGKSNQNFK